MEYVYRLSLPKIEEIVDLEKFYEVLQNDDLNNKQLCSASATDLLIPKYHDICGFRLHRFLIFLKHNRIGQIHSDVLDINDKQNVRWGINWIYNGISKIDFWHPTNFEILATKTTTHDDYAFIKTENPPDKSYILAKNCVYLINASIPHRITGLEKRYCFSGRMELDKYTNDWPTIVDRFKNLIISF